jgi:hypothetical protein
MKMHKMHWSLLLAAALAAPTFAQDTGDRAEDAADRTGRAVDRAGDAAGRAVDRTGKAVDGALTNDGKVVTAGVLPAGFTAKEANDVEDVRDLLGTATQAALTKDGFDDLTERLTDQDRNRIGHLDDVAAINDKVALIQKNFKDKYNRDFKVDHRVALTKVAVIQGEVSDAALATASWPGLRGSTTDLGDRAVPAAARDGDDAREREAERKEDVTEKANLEKGREVAIATFPAMGKTDALNVYLIGEATAWRIDIPNSITQDQLKANLVRHLTMVSDGFATWPANADEASALITHHVMMGLYDTRPVVDMDRPVEKTIEGRTAPEMR